MSDLAEQNLKPALSRVEQGLLDKVASGRVAEIVVRTGTTVDIGEWFRRGHVVGACLDGEWVMIAPGRKPFVERVSALLLKDSTYNHLVGMLVLAPAPGVQLRQLKMSPLAAGRALRWILNVSDEVAK